MRNRSLHQSLRSFAEQAAMQLSADAAGEAEVPFEVVEVPGERSALYCYRPLTGRFIRERLGVLATMPGHAPAIAALQGLHGLDAYLRLRGCARIPSDPGERAEAVLRTFLESLYEDTTEFEWTPARFSRAYSELEEAAYASRSLTAVIAPIYGLELQSEEVALDEDLSLVRADRLDHAPPEAVWAGREEGDPPNVLALLTVENGPESGAALEQARRRFARLLCALRLADSGGFGLGTVGWWRSDAGAWQLTLGLGGSGTRRGAPYRVVPEEEDELRGFCNLVARRLDTHARGEVGWAVRRFELGCERPRALDGLTDHLLALRALLEPEGPASGRVAQRLAAICALPQDRAALAERVAHAISLERAVVAGLEPAHPDVEGLVAEIADHARSLLRDVLCGHLQPDLVGVAEHLLAEAVTGETLAVPDDPVATRDPAGVA